jgi:hypothetical protein
MALGSPKKERILEIAHGAVLVIEGRHTNRIGFYCLQNQQLFDMVEIERCKDCHLEQAELKRLTTDIGSNQALESPIGYQSGAFCEPHKLTLANYEMAVVYWGRPYGENHSLIHPSKLVPISNFEYARYLKACQISADQALQDLLADLGLPASNTPS